MHCKKFWSLWQEHQPQLESLTDVKSVIQHILSNDQACVTSWKNTCRRMRVDWILPEGYIPPKRYSLLLGLSVRYSLILNPRNGIRLLASGHGPDNQTAQHLAQTVNCANETACHLTHDGLPGIFERLISWIFRSYYTRFFGGHLGYRKDPPIRT